MKILDSLKLNSKMKNFHKLQHRLRNPTPIEDEPKGCREGSDQGEALCLQYAAALPQKAGGCQLPSGRRN